MPDRYLQLEQFNHYQAEYIWIDAFLGTRSKTRTLDLPVAKSPSELPEWNYDGSSTGQAPGHDSEVILQPRAIFRDPFRRGNNILVMCDCYEPNGKPIPSNARAACREVMDRAANEEPWFGVEQNIPCLQLKNGLLVGPKMAILVHKDHITAALVQMFHLAVLLLKLITVHVYMQELK